MSHSTPEPAEGYDARRSLTPDEGAATTSGYEAGYEPAGTTGTAYTDPAYTETTYPVLEDDLVAPVPSGGGQGSGASQVKDTAKEQAGQVAGTAKEQAAQVKDTAKEQAGQVAGTAKEQAAQVKDTAVEQGRQVADVAKSEAGQVKQEATSQLRNLIGQSRSELANQASTSQNRLADYVHSLADELGTMASGGSDGTGQLADLGHRGARAGGELAHWLSEHEPADVLAEVTRFARRRPFAFLGASLLAGVVVGRVTRSLAAEAKDEHDAQQANGPVEVGGSLGTDYETSTAPTGYVAPGYAGAGYADTGYAGTTGVGTAGTVDQGGVGYANDPYAAPAPQSTPTGQAWLGEGR